MFVMYCVQGCAARNVHNFKQDQIQDMAERWEPAPPMYLQLDVSVSAHSSLQEWRAISFEVEILQYL